MSATDQAETITALAAVVEQEGAKALEVQGVVHEAVAAARGLTVRNEVEAQAATEILSSIARARRTSEDARKFLVKPLKDHAKEIDARFKAAAEPLDEADRIVRGKVIAYQQEQERLRQAEQARLDAEAAERRRLAEEDRQRQEAQARAEREAAAREAAAAEAAAKRAQDERRRQMQREADEIQRAVAGMEDTELAAIVATSFASEIGQAANQEIAHRRAAREATERAAAARAVEDAARAREAQAQAAVVPDVPAAIVAPAPALRSASGGVSTRLVWKATVEDPDRVPRPYLVVNHVAINAAVRAGVRDIPGVRIEQVPELAVRAR